MRRGHPVYIASIRPSVFATLRAAGTFSIDLNDDRIAASPEFEALAIEIFISKGATGKLVKTQGAPETYDYGYFEVIERAHKKQTRIGC
jgi:hypothetical protein